VRHDHRIPVMPVHLTALDHEPMGDDPVLYQIRVNGHLGPTLLTAFPALVPQQQGAETVLTGLLPDAAALYGVLAEIESLGLDLLEVRKVRPRRQQDPGFA
jgi:monoterpene epsilon-lactone hydrolase